MGKTEVLPNDAALADLAGRINTEHEACHASMQKGLGHALKAGALLLEAKAGLPHGEWLPWLENNCPDISERTVHRYMRLAENRDELGAKSATLADLTMRAAEEAFLPIRLTHSPTTCRVLPFPRIEFVEGRCADVASDAEQGAEGIEWVEAPVKAERELIEVGLKMLAADTVMDAVDPRFQIGEDQMDDRQIVLGNLWVATLGNGKVFIPPLAEAGISTPIVSDGQRPRSNSALNEPTKRVGAPVGHDGEPDTPGIAPVLSLVLRGSRFPMTHLNGTSDENLVVDTPAFAASPSTNPCLVYLNMLPRLAADTILIRPHHASAELVENAKGRLIARQAKLSLKLDRRDTGRLAGDQISRPKPCAQRGMATLHDRANHQARIAAALAAAQDTGTSGDAEGLAYGMAMRTDEPVAPSSFFHVGGTRRFIGEKPLKLRKRLREGQVITLKDVHSSLPILRT